MYPLLRTFFDDHLDEIARALRAYEPIEEPADFSNFTVVDGEEGDFGTIKYFIGGRHAATKIVEGGDVEYYEWTAYGKAYLLDNLQRALHNLSL